MAKSAASFKSAVIAVLDFKASAAVDADSAAAFFVAKSTASVTAAVAAVLITKSSAAVFAASAVETAASKIVRSA